MLHTKHCCGGQNAVLIEPLFPMFRTRNGQRVKYYTALYKCSKCGDVTLRGESQLREWNTFVEYVTSEDQKRKLLEERKAYELAKPTIGQVQKA